MIYDKWLKSWNEADVAAYKTLHHDDWEFKFHSTGNIMRTGDMSDEQLEGMMKNHVNENMRCIYDHQQSVPFFLWIRIPACSVQSTKFPMRKEAVLVAARLKRSSTKASDDCQKLREQISQMGGTPRV